MKSAELWHSIERPQLDVVLQGRWTPVFSKAQVQYQVPSISIAYNLI